MGYPAELEPYSGLPQKTAKNQRGHALKRWASAQDKELPASRGFQGDRLPRGGMEGMDGQSPTPGGFERDKCGFRGLSHLCQSPGELSKIRGPGARPAALYPSESRE